MVIKGLIFDFDGLILDTETPDVIAWMSIYNKYGQEFKFEQYASAIGSVYRLMEPAKELENLVPQLKAEKIFNEWTKLENKLIERQSILPGVMEYLDAAKKMNLKVAIASSSEKPWVKGHLERLGILNYFDFIHTVEETKVPKPDPALYNLALASFRLNPIEAIAFEDSANGISAAKGAGIFCVAVPNRVTRSLNLKHADLILDSLANLPLSQLLIRFK
jgi:HAD superfamily hydrolase (TIGR01509 family)